MTSKAQIRDESQIGDGRIERESNAVVARSSAFLSRSGQDAGLRYRKRALWLSGFYLPILIVPWILTCVMMYRPIALPSYISQKGAYSMTQLRRHEDWMTAVEVLSRITAVLAVPIVSAILAQGAVVYAQRRKVKQNLTVRQLLPLADRGWADPISLWNAFWKHRMGSTYLWLGAFLILIAVIQLPIQSILVSQQPKMLVTCNDNPKRTNNDDATCDTFPGIQKLIGFDPEPQELEKAPQNYVVHRTLQNIIAVSGSEVQPHLWRENLYEPRGSMDTRRLSFRYIYDLKLESDPEDEDERGEYYVSSIRNGSDTGVLRQHAVRMDSKAKCQYEGSFPEECPGDNPFTYTYNSNLTEVRVCAEGSVNKFPFTRSRNRQEISERIWFDLRWMNPDVFRDASNTQMENYTMSCEATTRRGWFELGNYQNGYGPTGILEQWPSPEEMEEDFNDYTSEATDNEFYPIEEEEPVDESSAGTIWDGPVNAFDNRLHVTSGPLMMSALALFGNTTYFHTAANTTRENRLKAAKDICQSGRIPFQVYSASYDNGQDILNTCSQWTIQNYEQDEDDDDHNDLMSNLVGGFMQTMEQLEDAQRMLEITMFFANEALLVGTGEMGSGFRAREIFSAPGYQILKPEKAVAGAVVISVMIALQVIGLMFLLVFIYSVPAWTDSFDADALVQIGGHLREQDQRFDVAGASGLVGVSDRNPMRTHAAGEDAWDEAEALCSTDRGQRMTKEYHSPGDQPTISLALGASGIITKRSHKQT